MERPWSNSIHSVFGNVRKCAQLKKITFLIDYLWTERSTATRFRQVGHVNDMHLLSFSGFGKCAQFLRSFKKGYLRLKILKWLLFFLNGQEKFSLLVTCFSPKYIMIFSQKVTQLSQFAHI